MGGGRGFRPTRGSAHCGGRRPGQATSAAEPSTVSTPCGFADRLATGLSATTQPDLLGVDWGCSDSTLTVVASRTSGTLLSTLDATEPQATQRELPTVFGQLNALDVRTGDRLHVDLTLAAPVLRRETALGAEFASFSLALPRVRDQSIDASTDFGARCRSRGARAHCVRKRSVGHRKPHRVGGRTAPCHRDLGRHTEQPRARVRALRACIFRSAPARRFFPDPSSRLVRSATLRTFPVGRSFPRVPHTTVLRRLIKHHGAEFLHCARESYGRSMTTGCP